MLQTINENYFTEKSHVYTCLTIENGVIISSDNFLEKMIKNFNLSNVTTQIDKVSKKVHKKVIYGYTPIWDKKLMIKDEPMNLQVVIDGDDTEERKVIIGTPVLINEYSYTEIGLEGEINMDKIVIKGGHKLQGTVHISGAKNAVLPVIAASIIASEGKSVIKDVPVLADVYTINEVLRNMNAEVGFENNTVTVDATDKLTTEAPFEYVRKMRASVLVLGPLLARYGHAKVALPGGCAIGSRPIDLHLKGFEAMGAEVHFGNGFVEVSVAGRLQGAKIYLDMPSVGATENIMMAAALAEGQTIIENCAKEPEIVDLANFLNKMGGKVVGAGTETIRIDGVEKLTGTEHAIIPDRVEAGTFMVAAAITGGNVFIENAVSEHLRSVIS